MAWHFWLYTVHHITNPWAFPMNIPIMEFTMDNGSCTSSSWRKWRTFLSHSYLVVGVRHELLASFLTLKRYRNICEYSFWHNSSMLLAQYYPWAMSWLKWSIVDQSRDLTIKAVTVSTGKLFEFQTKWQREFWTNVFKMRDILNINEG